MAYFISAFLYINARYLRREIWVFPVGTDLLIHKKLPYTLVDGILFTGYFSSYSAP